MSGALSEELKNEAIENMTVNMVALRTMLHLSQEELAGLVGASRQTLAAIENRKRRMTWSMFLSLSFVFYQREETRPLLGFFRICSPELMSVYSGR